MYKIKRHPGSNAPNLIDYINLGWALVFTSMIATQLNGIEGKKVISHVSHNVIDQIHSPNPHEY